MPGCPNQALANLNFAFTDVSDELNIEEPAEWYRVSAAQLNKIVWLPPKTSYLVDLLQKAYPGHEWDPKRFSLSQKKSHQRALLRTVKQIFQHMKVLFPAKCGRRAYKTYANFCISSRK